MRKCKTLFIIALVSVLSSCYSIDDYVGDGEFVDNGLRLKGGRYVLSLGEIPLNVRKKYRFNVSNLPPRYEFTVGLMVGKKIEEARRISANIKIELFDEKGGKVISESAALNKWTLSHGRDAPKVYAYIRGESYDQPIDGGNKVIPMHTGVDCGWGTYFKPRRGTGYVLTVAITPTRVENNAKGILMFKDVGQAKECA